MVPDAGGSNGPFSVSVNLVLSKPHIGPGKLQYDLIFS